MTDVPTPSDTSTKGRDLFIWILVWSELAAFGALLLGYLVLSSLHAESFSIAKAHLHHRLAGLSMVVLLIAASQAAFATRKQKNSWQQRVFLLATATLGLVFVVLKFVEYQSVWASAENDSSTLFLPLYFSITGFHLAHVAVLALLLALVAKNPSRFSVTTITTFWQVTGLIGLVIFPVIYLG